MVAGLLIIGFALEHHYHDMLISLGWGMYAGGIMIATTGYYQYCLDCYPTEAGEVAAWRASWSSSSDAGYTDPGKQ